MQSFIDRHGDARFSNTQADQQAPVVRDRAGWWRDCGPALQPWREYLFTAEGLREALKGFDFNRALDVLRDANMLKPNKDGTPSRVVSVDGQSKRLFAITSV